ncbi:MAG: VWA domain-containing protein [Phycisphaerales bacterium]|nr:MAG: VWA domain-containing protein [Phycisphaerales bacterium]
MHRYTFRRRRRAPADPRRRGVIAVLLLILLPVIAGFAALTVDVGVIYNSRTDLQRAADAAAMAAALALSDNQFSSDPLELARQEALSIISQNPVLGEQVTLDASTDIVFGRGNFDPTTSTYSFVASEVLPDAVRIIVRKTDTSANGPLNLYFAGIFGHNTTNVSASAAAAITPRDMVVVSDISGSLKFDSLLAYWPTRTINNWEVWDAIPGGSDDIEGISLWADDELLGDPAQSAGPAWGYFKRLGYGDDLNADGYLPSADGGMVQLRYNFTWNDADLTATLGERGYSAAEIDAINHPYNENYYDNRVAVALGMADWHSGMAGGRWEAEGVDPGDAGNGNVVIGDGEVVFNAAILGHPMSTSANIWRNYASFMKSSSRGSFRWRYGVKTWTDYMINQRVEADADTFRDTPLQPMQAIKDAIAFMAEMLWERQTADQMALMTYSNGGLHQIDLTHSFLEVRDSLDSMIPSGATNMGEGLELAIEELQSPRHRPLMRKVIVLITDGIANVDRWGNYSTYGGRQYALEEAQEAADLEYQIITVSVGQGADQSIMEEIATIGHGDHFHVEGSMEEYTADLINVFTQIGGRNVVDLIE